MNNEIPQDQLYIRSASVYRGDELLRTTDINLEAGDLKDDCIKLVLGVERDTDLVEIKVVQLSGPPADIFVMLAWFPFPGGGSGSLCCHAQSKGAGEVAVHFDLKGYKVPAMFGIRAVQAFEVVEPKPDPLLVQYDKRDVATDYIADLIGQIEHDAWEAGYEAAVRVAKHAFAPSVAQTLRGALADYWETQGVERED